MDDKPGLRTSDVSIWLTIAAAIVGGGFWLGMLQSQVNVDTQWIRDRQRVDIDSRLAVLETLIRQHMDGEINRRENGSR